MTTTAKMGMTRKMPAAEAPSTHKIPASVRVLRRLKPLIALILRSPMHALLSRDVLLLSWTGKKTGARYTLPISYTEVGARIYLCTRPEGSSWWRNVRTAGEVDLVLRGKTLRAIASVTDAASAEALSGLRAFLTRNPGTGRLLYHVETDANGKPRESDLEREVLASVVVRLEPI